MDPIEQIFTVLNNAGQAHYGESAVTQLEHAIQCAALAERDGASTALIAAALLHDIGHLVNLDDRQATVGHGLPSMKARANSLAGQCEIVSAPGRGTTVRVVIPLTRRPAGARKAS